MGQICSFFKKILSRQVFYNEPIYNLKKYNKKYMCGTGTCTFILFFILFFCSKYPGSTLFYFFTHLHIPYTQVYPYTCINMYVCMCTVSVNMCVLHTCVNNEFAPISNIYLHSILLDSIPTIYSLC
jgi:hypothetical protein